MSEGHDCVHWSETGPPSAPDRKILLWTRSNGYVVFIHDLDFGAILAATKADSSSLLLIALDERLAIHFLKESWVLPDGLPVERSNVNLPPNPGIMEVLRWSKTARHGQSRRNNYQDC